MRFLFTVPAVLIVGCMQPNPPELRELHNGVYDLFSEDGHEANPLSEVTIKIEGKVQSYISVNPLKKLLAPKHVEGNAKLVLEKGWPRKKVGTIRLSTKVLTETYDLSESVASRGLYCIDLVNNSPGDHTLLFFNDPNHELLASLEGARAK